jgi:hypothetical protein
MIPLAQLVTFSLFFAFGTTSAESPFGNHGGEMASLTILNTLTFVAVGVILSSFVMTRVLKRII